MKKSFGIYSIVWAICLALFNVIAFVTPNEIAGVSKFSGSFFVGYIFITVTFLAHLAASFAAFNVKNIKTLYYRLPLLSVGCIALAVMLLAGGAAMAIPALPEWSGIIVCSLILGAYLVALISAASAAGVVGGIDEKIDAKTAFMRALCADAHSLIAAAKGEALAAEAKRVYEAIRYSTPVSNDGTAALNERIKHQFTAFADAVGDGDGELAHEHADSLAALLRERENDLKNAAHR